MLTRATRRIVVPAFSALMFAATAGVGVATAAPYWLEGLRDYRVLDASGRVAPRIDPGAAGRNAYRPVFSPPPLMRARPFYPSGYAGARYGRGRTLNPTGYVGGRKACGHVGACPHGS